MNEARFFTTDGQEIARLEDTTLVPEWQKADRLGGDTDDAL